MKMETSFVSALLSKNIYLYCIVCVILQLSHQVSSASADGVEPVLVQLVFRHGDRSSVSTYPTNPYTEENWPQGYGQLSQDGMREHYDLGSYFRDRYIEGKPYQLLNSSYQRMEVEVHSTDYDRTLMSAYSHLAGMFPPLGKQIWDHKIPWQPIPVHTRPLSTDHVLYVDHEEECTKFQKSFNKTLNGEFVKKEEAENKEFYRFVANKTGFPSETVDTIWEVFDTLHCEELHPELGFTLPPWANRTFGDQTAMEKMASLESLQFTLKYAADPLRSRLTGGSLVGKIVENMKQISIHNMTQKYFIYSAHDTTVAAVMGALKVFNSLFPPYTATVIVELLKRTTNDEYFVRILYKNDTSLEPYTLQIPDCDTLCPLDKFISLTADCIPKDWKKECGIKGFTFGKQDMILIIVVSAVGLLVVMLLIIALAFWAKRQRKMKYHRYATLEPNS